MLKDDKERWDYTLFLLKRSLKLRKLCHEGAMSEDNVPGVGLEPTRPIRPQDFKSCVSTNSTTRA